MVAGVGTDTAVVTGMMSLTGLFTGWLGYRIRYCGDIHLIAGYRDNMDANTDALARAVGTAVLIMAVVTVFAGVLYVGLDAIPINELAYWSGYSMVVLILSGYAVITSRRYVSEP